MLRTRSSKTNDNDVLYAYMREVGRLKTLSREEEVALMKKIQKGDATAKERFVEMNLRLVISIAKPFANATESITLLDLIQEGNLGLMRAVQTFDHRRGFKFSTYATYWIRQHITRSIANTDGTVRIPVHTRDLMQRYMKKERACATALGREPTFDEITSAMGLASNEIDLLKQALLFQRTLSLDEEIADGDSSTLLDYVADTRPSQEEVMLERDLERDNVAKIQRMFVALTPREQEILWLRTGARGAKSTLASIGRQLKLSRERVRQIEGRALQKCLSTEELGHECC